MKKIILLLIIGLCGGATFCFGQQYPETDFYSVTPYLINPGFTGALTGLSGYVTGRRPMTQQVNQISNYRIAFNQSLERTQLGIGGKMTYDRRAFFESLYLDFSFAYKLVLDHKRVLSLGADVGIVNRSYSLDELSAYVDLSDPTLSSDYYYGTNFQMGLGLAYYSTSIEAGIAMPYIFDDSQAINQYFNAYFAYKHYFSQDRWILKPNAYWVSYLDKSEKVNLSLSVENRGRFWGQLGVSSTKEVSIGMGLKFDIYQLSYNYAYNWNQNSVAPSSTGEIMLSIHYSKSNKEFAHITTKRNRRVK
ncbi:PorP/SprF family type IX secretion system membrane protein [Reichenbachiella sp. MSK19-1]|uniref:PorP/SprF family type IX secretion system membrane protein n=1 Tax=Reichenbachiella sp. MSK19-1 TaxID=1897631 RepID=UPI000E6C58B0|nr:PorP/SprF family type IX secretion system membrane protein [Reichenbachiella sp. MSK19-1]RJE70623.1 hypothetical protein BGP76_11090 [Reichenbachiella sp. MSK19-1]